MEPLFAKFHKMSKRLYGKEMGENVGNVELNNILSLTILFLSVEEEQVLPTTFNYYVGSAIRKRELTFNIFILADKVDSKDDEK